jgi:hypothetical protein
VKRIETWRGKDAKKEKWIGSVKKGNKRRGYKCEEGGYAWRRGRVNKPIEAVRYCVNKWVKR